MSRHSLRHRRPHLLLMCGLFFLSACWDPRPSAWLNATGAEQFEKLWWQAAQGKNWPEVESHLASTYVWQSADGERDRAQTMDQLQKLQIAEFSMGETQVRPAGDVLIITYTMDLRGTLDGRPLAWRTQHMMTAWQQQKTGWIAIAHSGGNFAVSQ
jgi:ketosteroid isomerase-like protein